MGKEIKFDYKPHSKQEVLHQLCSEEGIFFIVVCAGRQSGKTYAAIVQALKWALEDSGSRTWIVSPSETQSKRIYKDLIGILSKTSLVKKTTSSSGNVQLELVNESIIDFKSSAMDDNLRGYSVDYLILDEAAFIDRDVFQTVILPTLNVRGKKVLIISTPRGRNWFYEYFNREDKTFRSLKFTYEDNPLSNLELINTIKKSLPEKIFRQEFLAEFVDGGQVFNNISDCFYVAKRVREPGIKYFAGIDIGLVNDYTVITIINSRSEVVDIIRFRELPIPVVKERIEQILNFWHIEKYYIEKNGIGFPISEDLKSKPNLLHKTIQFTTSNQSKNEIISNLISAFENKIIKIPSNEDLIKELNAFGFQYTPTGKIIYSAMYGHDDMVMSLAFAYDCLKTFGMRNRKIMLYT